MQRARDFSLLVPVFLGCLAIAVVIRLGGFDATMAFSHLVARILV